MNIAPGDPLVVRTSSGKRIVFPNLVGRYGASEPDTDAKHRH